MGAPDFWNNQDAANEVVQELKRVKSIIEPYDQMVEMVDDANILTDLAREDGSMDAEKEALEGVQAALQVLDKIELAQMLSGPHDARNAYLSIQAGAGGTESCDWAEMLLRMYTRYCERNEYGCDIIDLQPHEEAGIKSATLLVKGALAYGYLRSELGVHRLVRISPFDAQNRRHTSFCSVDVVPEFDEDIEVDVDEDELRIDTYRAGGAGGQHINKTDSAIRITHLPSGIVVQCQNERSQHKNRSTAMKMLRAKLYAVEEARRDAEIRGLQGEKGDIAWGRQIRSYVLQPYTLVKDVRTGVEKGNAQAVLDGGIDDFIEGFLRGQTTSAEDSKSDEPKPPKEDS